MSVLRRIFRSAGTGRFITRGEAESTPDWSVSETPDGELRAAAEQVILSKGYATETRVDVSVMSLNALERALKAGRS